MYKPVTYYLFQEFGESGENANWSVIVSTLLSSDLKTGTILPIFMLSRTISVRKDRLKI